MQYYQVLISAEQTSQAFRIMDALMARQLAFGGPYVTGPAKFLWNFKDSEADDSLRQHKLYTLEQDYGFIITYTREDLKQELIDVAESASMEEVCMISMMPMEANRSLQNLLDEAFEGRGAAQTPEAVDAISTLRFVPLSDGPTRTKSSTGPVGSRR